MPSRGMMAKAERQRRMRDIGAANVESPGDVLRIGHHQRVGAQFGESRRGCAAAFRRVLSPANLMSRKVTGPCGGAGRSFHSASIGLSSTATSVAPAAAQALRSFSALSVVCSQGSKPMVCAALDVFFQPLVGRALDQMLDGENRGVGLRLRLHGVAAVDEQHGALGEHDGRAGRTGEAGQPGEALFARRQIFVLLPVGARHHEAVELAALEFGAQARRPGRRFAARSLRSSNVWKRASNLVSNMAGTLALFSGWATQACVSRPAGHALHRQARWQAEFAENICCR